MTATHKPGKRATASDKDATLEQLRSALEASQREKAELLIENGRLRGQQAASGEILGIIARGVDGAGAARGVGGAQDVLDAIAQRASGLVRARSAVVVLVEGDLLRIRAAARGGDLLSPPSGSAGARQRAEGQPLAAEGPVAAAVRERRAVHVPDIESAAEAARYPSGLAAAREVGFRSVLSVPLLRGESAIGAIALTRAEPEPFTDDEIALIHTFADQAVIAIENARLFQQLQDTNRTLTERTQQLEGTLAQQTATSDVLRVIASSPNDRRAALEAVVERAARLCGADNATVRLVEGDEFVVAANYPSDLLPGMIGRRQRLGGDGLHERALRSGRTVHLPDTAADPLERHRLHRSGQRTAAAVPLLREGIPVGVLNAR
ncbi:MAG TPA: GAF domain-containing protein, partial [Chloroflexota bacterium]|nr:GAF domain-containing protein [Chloroflexota bacterium]